MRTANFRDDVVFRVALELGITPDPDLAPNVGAKYISSINMHLRNGWRFYDWPELRVVRERAFRPIWKASGIYSEGTEVFYLPDLTYFSVIDGQMPGAGVLPTNTTYFQGFNRTSSFIALDGDCQQSMGDVLGVYSADPRNNASNGVLEWWSNGAARELPYRISERGVEIQGAGATVFILFRLRPSKFTGALYDPTKSYLEGQRMFFTDPNLPELDGQVFRARTDAPAGFGPTASAYWAMVPFPEFLVDYVSLMTAADNADDTIAEATFRASAMESLRGEVDSLLVQGDRHHYRTSAGSRYHGGFWIGCPCAYAASVAVTTLTDDCVDPFGDSEGDVLVDESGNPILTDQMEEVAV
jgi:hypothetical protein